MKKSNENTKKDKWTEEEYNALPLWAKEIVKCIERTRKSALYYRRQAIAIRATLHDLCNTDANGLAFYDSVCKHAATLFNQLEEIYTKEEVKLMNNTRAEVIREAKKIEKKGSK